MEESRELTAMRLMAWDRAKGELKSMLNTYYTNECFDILSETIDNFIKDVEDNGKHE
jgi:hypothetical protein